MKIPVQHGKDIRRIIDKICAESLEYTTYRGVNFITVLDVSNRREGDHWEDLGVDG